MRALTIFHLMSVGIEAGNFWRALAVAALALSAFVLKRYWQSLGDQPGRVRISLVLLRAVSFLLLVGALAGVRLDYRSTTPGRVLVRYASDGNAGAPPSAEQLNRERSAIERTVAALKGRGFEAITLTEGSAPGVSGRDEGFAAAVLLSDGALSGADGRREVERAGASAGGAPVYVLTDLQQASGPSVALESVMVQGRAVRGVPLTLRCIVHGRRMRGHDSLITVSDPTKVQASSRISWKSDDERQTITLEVVPKTTGWIDYMARVEPAGSEDASVLSRSLTMYVEERPLRVLFFEGEPTWEAKFIRRALEQSGLFNLDYFAKVSRAATLGTTTADAAERQREEEENTGQTEGTTTSAGETESKAGASPEAKLHAALQSAANINHYDLIIVGATPSSMLSAAETARLSDWVARRGGGLIITGGNSFAASIAAPNGKLYALMPADVDGRGFASETQQVSRGAPLEAEKTGGKFALVPTEAGAAGALRGYLNATEGALATALGGQGLSLRGLRPGANVLATAGQGNIVEADNAGGAPLVAAMRYGAGRVLAFAPADSWRIRTSASGSQDDTSGPFGALWQGLALWTSEGARPQVEIVLDQESPAAGQLVTAEIRVRDRSFAPLKIERVKARLQPLGEDGGEATTNAAQPQEILFSPDEEQASVWRARFRVRTRGQFSLEADYLAANASGSVEKRFGVVAPTRMEAGAGLDTLSRAARESGGALFAADQLKDLLERLALRPYGKGSAHRTWELRTWWPLAILLPLLLCAEWFARRWWQAD